jgi:rhodanese-related sulfurtransferase
MPDSAVDRLDAAQVRAWLQAHPGALVLDARDLRDFERGHMPGSVRLDGRNHEALLQSNRARPVLITCYHGHASRTYAQMFSDFGFHCVVDVIGGRESWLRELPETLRAWLAAEGFADAQASGPHGNTPLMHAAWRGQVEVVRLLLELGVDLAAANNDGNNALWMACVANDPALVELLMRAGVDIDHANATGATCLMYAASSGKSVIARTLLALGADATLRTQDDFSALDMASNLECLQALRVGAPRHATP